MKTTQGILAAALIVTHAMAQSGLNHQTSNPVGAPAMQRALTPSSNDDGTPLSSVDGQYSGAPSIREVVLRDATPVRIRLNRTLTSAQSKTGDEVDFDVLDDIRVGNRMVIPRGAKAIGSVSEAQAKRRMGRGGQLNLVLNFVRLEDGTKVALRAEQDTKGGGHIGAMSAGMVAAAALGFGLPAPLFLLMHGKEAVVPVGTEITAYVDGDTHLPATTTIAYR